MNVLFLSDFYFRSTGGTQTSFSAQIDELRNQGHRVILLCASRYDRPWSQIEADIYAAPTVTFIRYDEHSMVDMVRARPRAVVKWARQFGNIDIVHCQTDLVLGQYAPKIARQLNAPLVQTMHTKNDIFIEQSSLMPRIQSLLALLTEMIITRTKSSIAQKHDLSFARRNIWVTMLNRCNRADAVVVASNHFAAEFVYRGIKKSKITVIGNGIPDEVVDAVKPRTSVHNKPFLVLWASRLSPEKRIDVMLDSFELVEHEAQLAIYGGGAEINQVRKKASTSLKKIIVHGQSTQQEVLDAMEKADLFVHTSINFDNQPMVIVEAIMAGVPIIYCDQLLSEMVPAAGARYCDDSSPEGLSKIIDDLISKPKEIARMRKATIAYRDTIRQSTKTARAVELYQKLIQDQVRSEP